jgi:hypothetical protein
MINLPLARNCPLGEWISPVFAWSDYILGDLPLTLEWFTISRLEINTDNEINTYDRPLVDWRGFLSSYRRGKQVSFSVTIVWDNNVSLAQKIDLFRKYLYTKNVNFDRKIGWEMRRMRLNCSSAPLVLEHYNITWARFDCQFSSIDESEYSINDSDLTIPWLSGDYEDEIFNEWTDITDFSVNFFIKSVGWEWEKTIIFSMWDVEFSVTQNLNVDDVLVFDFKNYLAKLNWVEIEWDWDIPVLNPEWNIFNLSMWDVTAEVIILWNEKFI